MIITVTLNPAMDKSVVIENFSENKTNRITDIRVDAGGKGINVSKTIKALGGDSLALGVVGGEIGEYIVSSMNRVNVRNDFVHVLEETRTNLKIYDPVKKLYTDINEPGAELSPVRLREIETKLFYYAKKGDIVVFAGGALLGIPADIVKRWGSRLIRLGVRVVADLDGDMLRRAVEIKPYLVKPNIDELTRLCGMSSDSPEAIAKAAKTLVSRGIKNVVVSRGAKGAVFADRESVLSAWAPRVTAVSTVGAGDAMTAALVYAMDKGMSRRDSIALALATATAKVTCEGNTPPPMEKIRPFIKKIKITEIK